MNIIIFSGSNRKNSHSFRISNYLKDKLKLLNVNPEIIDLYKYKFPLWDEDVDNTSPKFKKLFVNYSNILKQSFGFVFVVPEWNGMVPPQVKNLFFIFSNKGFAHKPGLIVSVSNTNGGAYPVAELRSFSYKNNRICWIPDHVIIRQVNDFNPKTDKRLDSRIEYSCKMLIEYAKALESVRKITDFDNFQNGM